MFSESVSAAAGWYCVRAHKEHTRPWTTFTLGWTDFFWKSSSAQLKESYSRALQSDLTPQSESITGPDHKFYVPYPFAPFRFICVCFTFWIHDFACTPREDEKLKCRSLIWRLYCPTNALVSTLDRTPHHRATDWCTKACSQSDVSLKVAVDFNAVVNSNVRQK